MSDHKHPLDATFQDVMSGAQKLADENQPDKTLVIMLNDDNGDYNIRFVNQGMNTPETISLLEIAKQIILKNTVR